tara:strand:+ start:2701 stop:3327 length:627 start_codon:yes stop_codon:yes gene_type:complete
MAKVSDSNSFRFGARESAAKQYGQRTDRRTEAIKAKDDLAKKAKGQVGELRMQAAANQKAIRYGASQATAMGMQPGMGSGGGALAAAGQVGRDAQMAGIAQARQDLDRTQSAELAAGQANIDAQEYAAQQGTKSADYSEALAQGETEAEQAIQDSQGFFNDDEAGAFRKIRAMIARVRVKSPEAAKALEDKYLREGSEGRDRIDSWWD